MCDYKKMSSELAKYIFGILLSVIGFFLVNSYNRTNEALAKINADIISLRIDVSELNARILTPERVKEIVKLELKQ